VLMGTASRAASHAGLAAQSQTKVPLEIVQPAGGACRNGGTFNQALGKGLTLTIWILASEPARLDPQGHRTALPRQILQPALIATVHQARQCTATGQAAVPARDAATIMRLSGAGRICRTSSPAGDQGQQMLKHDRAHR
jgi:hypothetical protein